MLRGPIYLLLLALAFLTLSSCGNGGGGTSTQEEGGPGTATLSWDAPTTNADGTPLDDLVGYKIYYGTSSGNYTESIDVGNVTNYQVKDLLSGTKYYVAVTAYDATGKESDFSNEDSRTIL